MQCFVFASCRKADTYVWLCQREGSDVLPASLSERLGQLRFVLTLELDEQRQLPRADAATVMAHLRERGWYLQLPPGAAGFPG